MSWLDLLGKWHYPLLHPIAPLLGMKLKARVEMGHGVHFHLPNLVLAASFSATLFLYIASGPILIPPVVVNTREGVHLSLLAVFCRGSVFSSGSHAERKPWPESGAYRILS